MRKILALLLVILCIGCQSKIQPQGTAGTGHEEGSAVETHDDAMSSETVTQGTSAQESNEPKAETSSVTENKDDAQQSASSPVNKTEQLSDESSEKPANEFFVEAFQFGYEPSEIHVKQGEEVTFHLKTRDVGHSMTIRAIGLDVRAGPGKDGVQKITFKEKGTYTWHCRVECGAGHSKMSGTLVVE